MQLERSLAGTWQFQVDPSGALMVTELVPDRQITVPMPWQAAFPDLQQYSGYAWYRRIVELDEPWLAAGLELLLKFGAVDYWCQVYINGHPAGEHEGGYTPFTFPIREFVHAGQNEISIRVYDPVQDRITIPRWPDYSNPDVATRPPFNAENVPHGKQEWYINVGGIWQDVTLTAVPETYIESVRLTTTIYNGQVEAVVKLSGKLSGDLPLSGTLHLSVLGEQASDTVSLAAGQSSYTLRLTVPDPRLWSPETPVLYTASICLQLDGTSRLETVHPTRFGFRELTTRDGQLMLNGEPLYLLAALDQDFYADTIYTVPSEAYLRDEFKRAKELGLNCLRCHIKVPDPLYLDLADEMGLLIWQEIPSWRTFYAKAPLHPNQLDLEDAIKDRATRILDTMITRDFNHPSLVIWSIVNEDWGTALALSAADRAWVSEMYDLCKRLDPTRLVVDNSACGNSWGPNVHVKSDLEDFHVYTNIPDQAKTFAKIIEQFGQRPLWTYSANGDAVRTGQEPLILSEFGNWGLPALGALRQAQGGELPWAELGAWWSAWEGAPGWPRGAETRFKQLGLESIWPSYDAFATATQMHQFEALKFEIEKLRCQPAINGYVITELSDIYWESNGLLDFYRQPKGFHAQFAAFNAPDMIAPELERYAVWDDQPVGLTVYASHYSSADWNGAQLNWSTPNAADVPSASVTDVQRGTVRRVDTQHLALAPVEWATKVPVSLSLQAADGHTLASSTIDLLVVPASVRCTDYHGQLMAILGGSNRSTSPEGLLFLQTLQQIGYQVDTRLTSTTKIILTDSPDGDMLQWVREGGDMLYLSTGPGPFFWCQSRVGAYGGSWITSYSWLRPGVHRRLDVTNPLTLPFMNVMPNGTIVGLPYEDQSVQCDFLAGQITGWVNHPAVHTVQFRYGKGRVIMTTFDLCNALLCDSSDPIPVAMLHDLIDHLVICQPVLVANIGSR